MVTRRDIIETIAGGALAASLQTISGPLAYAAQKRSEATTPVASWMSRWMARDKKLGGALRISRFRDPVYFLISPISWTPNLRDASKYVGVEVPTGFVTDFASIPPIFFSVLRPDGEYAYAAVIHDHLYWTQQRPRKEADEILKLAMLDLKVDSVKLLAIYEAVRTFGGSAWDQNAKLRSQGEKRVLIKFPDDPTINWGDWKKRPGVFGP